MAPVTDPTWCVILNPASGGGRAGRWWPRLRAAMDRRRIAHEFRTSTAPGDLATLAERAIRAGRRRLLALGGDGSFNEVINGVMNQAAVSPAECLLAVAPLGTGNDWAAALQMPGDPEALAACIQRARGRACDLGIAEDTEGRKRAFHNVAGAGLDAEVLRRTPRSGWRPIAYLTGLLRTVARFRAPRFDLVVDGMPRTGEYWLVLAAIGPRFGGGMRLAAAAEIDDGWFELVTVAPMSLPATLARLPKLYDGRLAQDRAISVLRCRSLTISADPPCGIELDGQEAGVTPVRLQIVPGGLQALDCRGTELAE